MREQPVLILWKQDIEATTDRYCDIPALETVYFGGGTPSLLPLQCVERIMSALRERIGIVTT
jgi:coproporphyrinogen III oxidase-like Fe-S oxidoreductase